MFPQIFRMRLWPPAATLNMDRMITLDINGSRRELDADPAMPLLWALRDLAGLTGTKYGCGKALCGACTVHLDGAPVRACVTPVAAAEGRKITTIEGLPGDGQHPVQRAWIELDVVQCGYCQSGQIMSAVALLAENPRPSDEDIDGAMSGNICRCGTYQRIRAAIKRAGELMTVGAAPVDPSQRRPMRGPVREPRTTPAPGGDGEPG